MRRTALAKIVMSTPACGAGRSVTRRYVAPFSGLRQVEEFTTTLHRLRRTAYVAAAVLILFALVCLALFLNDVNVLALYSAGALVLVIRTARIGADYFREEKRAAQAYWDYLDTYSYQVLTQLAHESARDSCLSPWSRFEVDRYLSVSHLVW